ncbi:MAG TPA: phosphotransferase, partial [Solirubrobacteraceae bacterium]
APVFGDPALGATAWLNGPSPLNQALLAQLLPAFLERYGDRVAPEHRAVCERLIASLDGWLADRRPPLGLVHGDYRLDNLLFGEPASPKPFTVVDWQTVGWGAPMHDASYFLAGALKVDDRRAHEQDLLREYHEALRSRGVEGLSWEDCWTDYRRQAFRGVLMAIAASMIVERTPRGDEMFVTMLARHAQQAIDLDAADLLPAAGSGRAPALRPDPADEGRHEPGPEELWNESWYFDAVAPDGSIGAYVRLGLYPNLGVCWYTAFVCRPGRPAVAILDFAGPVPEGDRLAVETARGSADHRCEAPLERFAVRFDGHGEAHDDAAAVLRGEAGRPVPVALDLVWETLGEPYAYRLATRYEIPCRVTGTIRVGDERRDLRAVGQRDHSWGTRDWWGMDWVWSAGHLQDGTRFHGGEFRLPNVPPVSAGYVQPPDGGVVEPDAVVASEEVGADGLITRASLRFEPGLSLSIEPLAFGPLRLVAPDGRVSSFPRAMCRVEASDGRTGVAWVEWNRNAP